MQSGGLMSMFGLAPAMKVAEEQTTTAGGHRVISAKTHAKAKARRKQQKRSRKANR